MEKTYRVVGNTGRWAVAEDDAEPAGTYATREGALEAIYLAASNDIKKGLGVTIRSTLQHRTNLLQAAGLSFHLSPAQESFGLICSASVRNAANADRYSRSATFRPAYRLGAVARRLRGEGSL